MKPRGHRLKRISLMSVFRRLCKVLVNTIGDYVGFITVKVVLHVFRSVDIFGLVLQITS